MLRILLAAAVWISLGARLSATQAPEISATEQAYMAKAQRNVELYRKQDATIEILDASGRPLQGAQVEVNQVQQDFLFGCILFPLTNPDLPSAEREQYQKRFLELFNLGVLPFYWKEYEPTFGKPRWPDMASTLEWCARNGVTVKGHPLVWTSPPHIPSWLSQFPVAYQEKLLEFRVLSTVAGYAGAVNLWDVVNEPVHVNTWEDKDLPEKSYTPGEWADYVGKALRWANAANPRATLLINEYDIIPNRDTFRKQETPPRDRFLALTKELRHRNAPPFDVGFQAHEPRSEWFRPQDVWQAFDTFAGEGFRIHITEFIPQSSGKEITGWRRGTWTEEAQAEFAEQMLRLSFGHPGVDSFNFWGLSDRDIWLPGGGLVDQDYNPKPVFTRVRKLIREEWMTRSLSLKTDQQGCATFRGFLGKYRIHVRAPSGKQADFDFHLRRGGEREFRFQM
jgi:GH35 family endo-1,4-beta-xylanase